MSEIIALVVFANLALVSLYRIHSARQAPVPVWVSDPMVHVREVERLAASQPMAPEAIVLRAVSRNGSVDLMWDVDP